MKIKDWYKENKQHFSLSELNFIFKSLGIEGSLYWPGIDNSLNSRQIKVLLKLRDNQLKKVPLSLSLGRQDFLGRVFKLNSKTLIPRPETEILVKEAQKVIKDNNLKTVLDLCCGCGNIGISLDKLFSGKIRVCLSDLSQAALAAAEKNAIKFKSNSQIVASDLFSAFEFSSFDLIISNPPYVESKNIKGSLLYEPREALDGGEDGLFFIKKIINQAHNYLKDNGYLIVEFGYGQKKKVEQIIKKSRYKIDQWVKDYAHIWRGVILRNG